MRMTYDGSIQRTSWPRQLPVKPRTRVRLLKVNSTHTIARLLAISLLSSSLLSACCLPVPTQTEADRRADNSLVPFDILPYETENTSNGRIQGATTFQGDILFRGASVEEYSLQSKRAVTRHDIHRWDNAVVPYAFDSMFPLTARRKVLRAVSHWQKKTCIQFIPRSTEPYFIKFTLADFCASDVGRQESLKYLGQEVYLNKACTNNRGNVLHELGHVVGLYHEVTRYDRDQYIEIFWENILPGAEYWFQPIPHTEIDSLGVPYDPGSIMHFSPDAYSKNGNDTLRVRDNVTFEGQVGQRDSLSDLDVRQIELFYGCHNIHRNTTEPESLAIIRAGNEVALKAVESSRFPWLMCGSDGCSLDNCPGKKFKPDKEERCSSNIFSFFNLDDSKRLLVGNRVILRTRMNMTSGIGELVLCDSTSCSSSGLCEKNVMINDGRCTDQTFIINVPGKSDGEELYHQDRIILSYEPGEYQKVWMGGCDSDGASCQRFQCNYNLLGEGSGAKSDCPTEQIFEVLKLPYPEGHFDQTEQ